MNKQAISNALKALQKTVKKHSPEILTGIGIAGMTAAAVMAVKATPKALRMVDEKEIRRMLRGLHHRGQFHQRTAQRGPGHSLHHFGDRVEGVPGQGG